MEVDQIQCKFPKISNGGYASTIVSQREKMDDDEDKGENRQSNPNNFPSGGAIDPGGGGGVVGLYGWPSSRIVRVSRATGGKDRHSKVLTSRGLRDRRVRLSVNTAIEFYDLQDRLGYDQPSKAVEWLLAAAASSIAELPPMNSPFSLPNNRPREEENKSAADRRMITVQQGAAAKSPVGSSSSETSKGSGVSISRSEKAKEKEKESEKSAYVASFTELLSGGGISYVNGGGGAERDQRPGNDENSNFVFPRFPLDYFSSGGLSVPAAAPLHLGELQPPLSFSSDHLVSAINNNNNRGTLQSNSSTPPSLHFPPNFFGGGAPPAANHRHFLPGFDPRLQLYYGNDGGQERKDKP